MFGAIIGDIVGSRFEFLGMKSKDFRFITDTCRITDDTAMTVAVASAILRCMREKKPLKLLLIEEMQRIGRKYPYLGYGGMFYSWIFSETPAPYYSYGNGSAMRVSPCALFAVTLEEAITLARASAEVTHNHPEGIKGAEATAAALFLAKTGSSKEEIGGYICDHYYSLSKTLWQIWPHYSFDVTCQGSVPQAITAFLESKNYEDAIRNAISLGGDADTLGSICGGIAWAYYKYNSEKHFPASSQSLSLPEWCENLLQRNKVKELIPEEFLAIIEQFELARTMRASVYEATGECFRLPI